MNNRYIQGMADDELAARCVHSLTGAGLGVDPVILRRAMPLVKERMKTLAEAPDLLRFLFTDDIELNDKARNLIDKAPPGYLRAAAEALGALPAWNAESIGTALDGVAEERG